MIDNLRRFNWVSFVTMVALIILGTIFIGSAGAARSNEVFHGMWKTNLVSASFGLAIYFILAFTDYRKLLGWASVPLYLMSIILLVAVLVFGAKIYGGRRWLWFFQPSEIAKVCVICLLARLFGEKEGPIERLRTRFAGFLIGAALVGIPCVLILLEPDLGTALTLVPAAVLMFFAARVWRKGLATLLILGVFGSATLLGAVYMAEKPGADPARREAILKWIPLKDHQIKRVKVYLFPDEDIHGAGYNLRQAMISIGSGGLVGRGIGEGRTNHLKYLPESISMNDFIFCVYAEETGFVGALALLSLMGLLLGSCMWTAFVAADGCGRLLTLGFAMLVFAHVFINIAMSIGLVPITGLPLPFMSSGRTFLLMVLSGFGLIQSVSIHGREKK